MSEENSCVKKSGFPLRTLTENQNLDGKGKKSTTTGKNDTPLQKKKRNVGTCRDRKEKKQNKKNDNTT